MCLSDYTIRKPSVTFWPVTFHQRFGRLVEFECIFWRFWVWNTFYLTVSKTYDWFKTRKRFGSSTFSFILHFTTFLTFSSNYFSFLGVSVVSWSLMTVHTTPAIALQLMWGSYNGQQRPLTSKNDTKFHSVCVRILVFENSNNLIRKTKSKPEVLLEFSQGARRAQGGKSKSQTK